MKEEKFKINEQNWFGERRNSTAKKIYIYPEKKGKHHQQHK